MAGEHSRKGILGHKLTLAYVGTAFSGWQRQKGRRTVQAVLEEAIQRIWEAPILVAAAGRTDAGVHALGQVASFAAPGKLSPEKLVFALNYHLPPDVRVMAVEWVEPEFHARFDCRAKTYEYRIWNAPVLDPFEWMRAWHIPHPLELEPMQQAASTLVGTHDFGSFASSTGRPVRNTVRTVFSLTLEERRPWIVIRVQADGFLYHMARKIAAALVRIGKGKLSPLCVQKLLREPRGHTLFGAAPPWGLYFCHALYPSPEERTRRRDNRPKG
ncbi:tRNA pseudouridine(38-40) synthase TruA [Candidatus Methylacidithermus pantelleriae]|uniref:tRNA pseudouridine synthase A n=1 Tax=Candidatus Methylacidithermus pantelleriae TaxID=2744239 RepID=A0A8J2BR87_9BACT|nr:tRNA pseudouridine(38-40) synthase TruA [Candidatus Methylacidithermus pantelleriae]CAF0700957.1 tRNA pseudouridine synthase A [Candidatus Methylacidithermus pantelleriae]